MDKPRPMTAQEFPFGQPVSRWQQLQQMLGLAPALQGGPNVRPATAQDLAMIFGTQTQPGILSALMGRSQAQANTVPPEVWLEGLK